MKQRVLFFPFPFLSHYLRCIVFARILRERYEVVFAAHPAFDKFLLEDGFATFAVRTFKPEEVALKLSQFDFSWLDSAEVEAIYLDECRVIREWQPHFVVADNLATLKLAGEQTKTPVVSLLNLYMTKDYRGRSLPVDHYASRIIERISPRLKTLSLMYGERLYFKHIHYGLSTVRKKHGLSKMENYLQELETEVNFCVDSPGLFFPGDQLPSKTPVIGPLIYNPLSPGALPDIPLDKTKKTILVSLGSTGNWKDVVFLNDKLFRSFNIIAAGDKAGVLRQTTGWHFDFLPIARIIPRVDLVICHGGNGTIYQALSFGKPVACCPVNVEQQWNSDAVERQRFGKRIPKNCSAAEAKVLLDFVLELGRAPHLSDMAKAIGRQQQELADRVWSGLKDFFLLKA